MAMFCILWVTSNVFAPIPSDNTSQPRLSIIWATLGKTHTSKEVRALGRALKEDPLIQYSLWSGSQDGQDEDGDDRLFYLIWRAKGIDLNIKDGKVVLVSLYNDGSDEHKLYRGELPSQLTFADSMEAIEKKLGKPEEVTELPQRKLKGSEKLWEDLWLDYPRKGIEIILRRPVGGSWAIHLIKVTSPKK